MEGGFDDPECIEFSCDNYQLSVKLGCSDVVRVVAGRRETPQRLKPLIDWMKKFSPIDNLGRDPSLRSGRQLGMESLALGQRNLSGV